MTEHRPVTPGDDDTRPSAVPGAYAAADDDRERAVEPGTGVTGC